MAETIIKFYLSCPAGESLLSPVGVAESPEGDGLYGSPPGRSFCAYKRNQNTLGAAPQDPDASEPPRPETLRIPGAGLDDADKEPQARLIRSLQNPK